MCRRIILTLTILIATAVGAVAQHAIGEWEVYNSFTSAATSLIDTRDKVYLINDRNLYAYDKSDDELSSYNVNNGLSEMGIDEIYRNYDRDYIVVAYENSNIDVLYDNDRIVNMPDIKDAQSVTNKTINDIAFDGDIMFVATGFGLVKYDVKSHSVIESGIYNLNVSAVTIMDDYIVMLCNGSVRVAPKDQKLSNFSEFRIIGYHSGTDLEAVSNRIAVSTNGMSDIGTATFMYIDPSAGKFDIKERISYGRAAKIRRFGDKIQLGNTFGMILAWPVEDSYTYYYIGLPSEIRINNYVAYNGGARSDEFWYVNRDGLGRGKFDSANYSISVGTDSQIKPIATSVDNGIGRMTQGSNGIYLYNLLATRYPSRFDLIGVGAINKLSDGFSENITPTDLVLRKPTVKYLNANFKVEEDPTDPSSYYLGTWYEGIYKIKDGEMVQKLDWRNMPVDSSYAYAGLNIVFDQQRNMWVYLRTAETLRILVLPSDKVNAATISKSDWIRVYIPDFDGVDTYNPAIVPLKHSKNRNLMVLSQGWDSDYMVFYDTAGTPTTTDDKYYMTNKFVDQDAYTFGPLRTISVVEDNNGSVWVGTADGVFAIHNLPAMLTGNGTVERIKVPRNDGTDLADYLLSTQTVTAIAVDGANRKWIGTTSSGLYLVSPDGREILEHFTSENSALSSETIYDVVCEAGSNRVYVSTPTGLLCYHSSSAPASADLSDVYAFPNPVRPDYTGWITIKGLMDDSLVKITNAAGHVLHQTRSEGGMVVWDGCNDSGDRVRTGVYYVLASAGSDGSGSKDARVVTKILVVN